MRKRTIGGKAISAADYIEELARRKRAAAAFAEWMRGRDALLTPTLPITATALDEVDEVATPLATFTRVANYLGICGSVAAGGHVGGRAAGRGATARRAVRRGDAGPRRPRVPARHRLASAAPGSLGVGNRGARLAAVSGDRGARMSHDPVGLLLKAVAFAAEKHRDQRRKDADASPYINHPIELASLLKQQGIADITVLCAALLHDTIEDTNTTDDELQREFGDSITAVVREVTDDKTLHKSDRKRLQIEHARSLSNRARLVKLADKICNLRDIVASPPANWPRQRKKLTACAARPDTVIPTRSRARVTESIQASALGRAPLVARHFAFADHRRLHRTARGRHLRRAARSSI